MPRAASILASATLIVAFATGLCTAGHAERDKHPLASLAFEELLELEIISASRSETRVKDLPLTVYVITHEEIIRNNYTSLVSALKAIPGVKVSQPSVANFGDGFLVRGFLGNYYTKLLIDGVPIQPSVVGGMPIDEQIPIRNAERIELVLGPTSSLFGADALVGVINIVTKRPQGYGGRIDVYAGELGYLYSHVRAEHVFGEGKNRVRLAVSGLYSRREDLDVKDNYSDLYDPRRYGGTSAEVDLGDLPYRNRSFGLQLGFRDLDISYLVMKRRNHSSTGLNTDYYAYDDPSALWGETIHSAAARHRTALRRVVLSGSLSYLRYRLDNRSYYAFAYGDIDAYKYEASDDILLEEVATWDVGKGFELLSGVSYQYSGALPKTNDLEQPFDEDWYHSFSRDLPPPHPLFGHFGYNPLRYSNKAIFVQGKLASARHVLLAGARYDRHSEYGSSLSPRLAFLLRLSDDTTLRASYSEGFRAPSPYYSYNSIAVRREREDGTEGINYFSIPNPDLRPEDFRAIELGLRRVLSTKASLDVVGFHHELEGLVSAKTIAIDPEQYPNSWDPTRDRAGIFVNDGTSTLWGVELALSLRNLMSPVDLGSDLSVCYSDGHEQLPGGGGKIDTFRGAPHWLAKWRLSLRPLESLYLSLDATYSSSWYSREISDLEEYREPWARTDGDVVVDANASFTLSDSVSASLRVNNVLDEAYGGVEAFGSTTELDYSPQPGRSVFFGVGYCFSWAGPP